MITKDDLIYSYSRAQAIADGVLIDVTQDARRHGFRQPVALTSTVWATCVRVREDATDLSESKKLDELLRTLREALKGLEKPTASCVFRIDVEEYRTIFTIHRVKVVGGPDDDGSPCLTVMMPDED